MSRTVAKRVLALSALSGRAEAPAFAKPGLQCLQKQQFSLTTRRRADDEGQYRMTTPAEPKSPVDWSQSHTKPSSSTNPEGAGLSHLSSVFEDAQATPTSRSRFSNRLSSSLTLNERYEEPHHLHVYATKHNTHITLTKPSRDPLISMSTGNIGFKKSQRKHYDSAFQLAGFVFGRMRDTGLLPQIKKLEVCLRGFGQGREAVTKAILGAEGKGFRGKIVKVTDATRLKFGGTRSPRPRRLG